MADLSITAANVKAREGATTKWVTAGETITEGQPIHKRSLDGRYYRCDADAAESSVAEGVAVTPAAAGEPVLMVTVGELAAGATVAVGQVYVVSANAGGIAPYGDLASGNFVTILGVGISTSVIELDINVSGIQKA